MRESTGSQQTAAALWWTLGGIAAILFISAAAGLYAGRNAADWPLAGVPEDAPGINWSRLNDYPREDIPDLTEIADVDAMKQEFFEFLLPMVRHENERVRKIREQLAYWRDRTAAGAELSDRALRRIEDFAERYYVEPEQPVEDVLAALWRRVDTLPASMVLAQAANESAWGGSRFAREGNNLFGQWCFSEGCGIVPSGRPEGETYEVRDFDSPALSVRAFMLNLNRHRSYSELRAARADLRARGNEISGLDLVPHLEAYSTRREAYVEEIRNMIIFNDLLQYDQLPEDEG